MMAEQLQTGVQLRVTGIAGDNTIVWVGVASAITVWVGVASSVTVWVGVASPVAVWMGVASPATIHSIMQNIPSCPFSETTSLRFRDTFSSSPKEGATRAL